MTKAPSAIRILLTPGEPAGVGPELAIMLAQKQLPYELVAIADPDLLEQRAKQLGLPLSIETLHEKKTEAATDQTKTHAVKKAHTIKVIPVRLAQASKPGILDQKNAAYVLECLQTANDMLLQNKANAVVTGPVQKSVINDAGIAFSGHTEFFAEKSGTSKVVMMLATEGLRVALATTHLPLKDVSSAITQASLSEVITILHKDLQTKFAIEQPNILVCGLNPHAGENGHLGTEELTTINPVLDALRNEGMNLVGPLPADTLFNPKYLKQANAVLAMYHDQGLPVLKYKGFGAAVNITLGLPYIRTSVDHGTALDIAGKGLCDPGSMQVALDYAVELATATHSNNS